MSKVLKPAAKAVRGEFTVVESKFNNLLGEGDHVVTIDQIHFIDCPTKETNPDGTLLWDDTMPQTQVLCKNDDGQFTVWLNEQARVKFNSLTAAQRASGQFVPRKSKFGKDAYAVEINTNERIVAPASSEEAQSVNSIISEWGKNALNLEVGTPFNVADLIGEQIGLHIEKNANGQLRATYTMPADKVTA